MKEQENVAVNADSAFRRQTCRRIDADESHHVHVSVSVSEGAEVGHCVLDERPEDEAEADAQVHVDGLDETVGVGQRRPGPHHERGHGQNGGDSWKNRTSTTKYNIGACREHRQFVSAAPFKKSNIQQNVQNFESILEKKWQN